MSHSNSIVHADPLNQPIAEVANQNFNQEVQPEQIIQIEDQPEAAEVAGRNPNADILNTSRQSAINVTSSRRSLGNQRTN